MEEIGLKEKLSLLHTVPIFADLKEEELTIVARYSVFYKFEENEVIFKAGSVAEELHVIQDGDVVIKKHIDEQEDLTVAHFISGDFFGELDLLDESPRTATAIAEKESTILIFPGKGFVFKDIITHYPRVFAAILHKLMTIISLRIRSLDNLIIEKAPWVEDLKLQLYRDKVTGMYNRAYMEDELPRLLQDTNSCLLVVKPDNFKDINDIYGHDAGDKSLVVLADSITRLVREQDIVIRYKGNEFSVMLPDTSLSTAYEIAEKLRNGVKAINISHITNNEDFFMYLSIGVVDYPEHAENFETLIKKGYEHMFIARNSGGDKISGI